jgi:hypothetical protein
MTDEAKKTDIEYTTDDLQLVVFVHYNTEGRFDSLRLAMNCGPPIQEFPEGEGDAIADVFERALYRAQAMALTRRVKYPDELTP